MKYSQNLVVPKLGMIEQTLLTNFIGVVLMNCLRHQMTKNLRYGQHSTQMLRTINILRLAIFQVVMSEYGAAES